MNFKITQLERDNGEHYFKVELGSLSFICDNEDDKMALRNILSFLFMKIEDNNGEKIDNNIRSQYIKLIQAINDDLPKFFEIYYKKYTNNPIKDTREDFISILKTEYHIE